MKFTRITRFHNADRVTDRRKVRTGDFDRFLRLMVETKTVPNLATAILPFEDRVFDFELGTVPRLRRLEFGLRDLGGIFVGRNRFKRNGRIDLRCVKIKLSHCFLL